MKQKWKRRCRGAISIFLIIIFLAQYILCGLLVDSARHRMASAMAESALDSASESVLSYYNELLMDLYGLMATDGLSKKDIQDKLNSYVERTLGVAELDNTSALKTITELVGAALGGADDPAGFDGYDFQLKVETNTTTSLANTDFVEYQLIEHMKFRAPVLMLSDSKGFLAKLGGLMDIKERLEMVKEKMSLAEAQKDNITATENTLESINTFIQQVRAYVIEPAEWKEGKTSTAADPVTPKDVKEYIKPIDDAAKEAAKDYLEEWKDYREDYEAYEEACENAGPEDPEPQKPKEPEWTLEDWQNALKPGKEAALKSYKNVRSNAEKIKTRAHELLDAINTEVKSYTEHIGALKDAQDSYTKSPENAQTVFAPEAELAKANAGQLLKNRPFLVYVEEFAGKIAATNNIVVIDDNIATIMGTHGKALVPMANDLQGKMRVVEGLEGQDTLPDPICTTAADMMKDPAVDFTWMINNLQYLADVLEKDAVPNVKKSQVDVKVKEEEKKKEEDVEKKNEKLRDLRESELKIEYETVTTPGNSKAEEFNTDIDVDTKKGGEMLNAAGGVLDMLMQMLEGVRDNIYLNEYVAYYFPNYVDVYNCPEKVGKNDNAQKFISGDYKDYCATQAELEYVLTGDPDTGASVLKVQGMLLGVRTAFNMIAVFTDSAKVSQANAIAAVAGPFAPLAAIALLIAWAVAESVLDVVDLCNGEEVPLFKQGSDWKLSAGGAGKAVVKAAASALVDYGVELLNDKISSMVDQVQSASEKAIYEAYNKATDNNYTVGVAKAKETMNQWSKDLNNSIAAVEGDTSAVRGAITNTVNELNQAMDLASDKVGDVALKGKDLAVKKVKAASDKVKTVATNKLENIGDQLSDNVAEAVGGWIDKSGKLPVGDVVSDKGATSKFPGMTYMDYMKIFLLMTNETKKVQRIQSLVQANIRYKETGGDEEKSGTFSMAESYGAVEATLNGSIKFLFMSEPIIPASMRQDGRLKLSAHSAVSY